MNEHDKPLISHAALREAWRRGYESGTTYGIAYQAGAYSALEDGEKFNPYRDRSNDRKD